MQLVCYWCVFMSSLLWEKKKKKELKSKNAELAHSKWNVLTFCCYYSTDKTSWSNYFDVRCLMQPASNTESTRGRHDAPSACFPDSERRMCAGWDEPTGSVWGVFFCSIYIIRINWLLAQKKRVFLFADLPADAACSSSRESAISIFHYLLIPLCCCSCPNLISFSH